MINFCAGTNHPLNHLPFQPAFRNGSQTYIINDKLPIKVDLTRHPTRPSVTTPGDRRPRNLPTAEATSDQPD